MRSQRQADRVGLPGGRSGARDLAHLENFAPSSTRVTGVLESRGPLEIPCTPPVGYVTFSLKKKRRAAPRERIRALHLERVLCRQHEKRLFEMGVVVPTDTLTSCIASSRRLGLGVARLISSGQRDVPKIGPAGTRRAVRQGCSCTMFVPTMSAGIRSK